MEDTWDAAVSTPLTFNPWDALAELEKSAPADLGSPAPAVRPGEQDRRAWSDDLCHRLHAGIAQQSPPGLGPWPKAWEIVEEPSKRLLDLLGDWERTGNEADQRAAIVAAEDVALAWERAAFAWQAARTPSRVA